MTNKNKNKKTTTCECRTATPEDVPSCKMLTLILDILYTCLDDVVEYEFLVDGKHTVSNASVKAVIDAFQHPIGDAPRVFNKTLINVSICTLAQVVGSKQERIDWCIRSAEAGKEHMPADEWATLMIYFRGLAAAAK